MANDSMAGWQVRTLFDVAEYINGRPTRPSELQQSGVPVVKIAELTGGISRRSDRVAAGVVADKHWVQDGDLLFAWSGSVGVHVYRGPRAALNQHIFRVVARDGIDQRFLRYLLLGQLDTFLGLVEDKKTTMGHVTVADLRRTRVSVPPLRVQRPIANILGTIDERIDLSLRMSRALETLARALFRSWFVDFGPVRAKVQGHEPGLPRPVAALFPDRLVDSKQGTVPEGWQWKPLHDVLAELETGGRPPGGVSGYVEGVPSVGAESIVGLGVFDYSKTRYVPTEYFHAMKKGRAKSRDVLLYKDGGRPGEFEPHVAMFGDAFPFETFAINEHVYRVRAKPELGQNYLFFWLSERSAMEEMRSRGTGVAIPGLNSTQVKSLAVLVPPEDVARAFDALVEPMVAGVLASSMGARKLSILRNALLPKLISGELGVPQGMIEAARA